MVLSTAANQLSPDTPMPRVTVVMPMYNAAQFVSEAVASVLAQTYRDFELIVVDDASGDSSLAIVEAVHDSRVRVIRHESNKGASLSRNEALAEARGEFVAIMDADDVCAPTRLERQVAFLDAHHLVGVVGCAFYDNIDVSGAVLHSSYAPEENEAIQRTLMERWCLLHSSLMFRRALYERVGGYRKEFEPAEDHDFILRMLEHSQAHNLNEGLVSYRLNPKGLTVAGYRYVDELREVATQLAQRRRSGQPEGLEREIGRVRELRQGYRAPGGLAAAVQVWRDSWDGANRYYGFGCRELCAGRLDRARRCFVRSLCTNALFVKSWIGVALSLMPIAATGLKFVFRSSMELNNDLVVASMGQQDVGHLASVANLTSDN